MSGYKRAEVTMQQDDGYAKLLCIHPGCGRRWSVLLDGPKCSLHAWGAVSEPFASMASSINSEDPNHDGKRWARRILAQHKDGFTIRPISLDMARKALRVREAA